jgi:hypothetical protein
MRLARLAVPALLALALAGPLAGPVAAQGSAATATPGHRAAVQRLLEVTRMRTMMEQTAESMLRAQLQQTPQLGPYAEVLREFYREQTDWRVLEPEFTRLYLEVFTEGELRELIAFYEAPIGQKMLEKMPALMVRSQQMVMARLQTAMPRLMERLQAASPGATPPDTTKARRP